MSAQLDRGRTLVRLNRVKDGPTTQSTSPASERQPTRIPSAPPHRPNEYEAYQIHLGRSQSTDSRATANTIGNSTEALVFGDGHQTLPYSDYQAQMQNVQSAKEKWVCILGRCALAFSIPKFTFPFVMANKSIKDLGTRMQGEAALLQISLPKDFIAPDNASCVWQCNSRRTNAVLTREMRLSYKNGKHGKILEIGGDAQIVYACFAQEPEWVSPGQENTWRSGICRQLGIPPIIHKVFKVKTSCETSGGARLIACSMDWTCKIVDGDIK